MTYVGCLENYLTKARLTAELLPAISIIKAEIVFHRAITGEWPRNITLQGDELDRDDLPLTSKADLTYVTKLVIDNGSIHATLGYRGDEDQPGLDNIKGKTLSFRFAVPENDVLGPVIFVAGNANQYPGWKFSGSDRTDLSSSLYPYLWQ